MMVSWVSKFRIFRGQQVSWNNIFYTAIVDHDIPAVYQLWDGLDQVKRQSLSQSISGGVELACILSSADQSVQSKMKDWAELINLTG
ncbi:unnamed protein product [Sphagnum jensenii]|jgi:hypothetical protein|uniref:Uncharacterized protein n=1 Tax=Sphagnum jensenii TaxID=128206 RepID=A0ABP0VVV3_9BRYO